MLDEFGFSGWIGPEPHGGKLGNSGLRRDGIFADRAAEWLTDRYARRNAGDPSAQRPFLLVVSFVNPHDIALFPGWKRNDPLPADPFGTPLISSPPTADEDLLDKPTSQRAYRDAHTSGYAPIADDVYEFNDDEYRQLYYRLHALVDDPLDRVRRAVTDGWGAAYPCMCHTMCRRTSKPSWHGTRNTVGSWSGHSTMPPAGRRRTSRRIVPSHSPTNGSCRT